MTEMLECRNCPFADSRFVPGEGSGLNGVMVVGEAPGRDEDRVGRPFVGAAGRRLDVLLRAAGLKREDCYVTNVVKRRPPDNRTPRKAEVDACIHHLRAEVERVQPAVILALGNTAVRVFDRSVRLADEHGIPRYLPDGRILVPLYHPAAALHNPNLWPSLLRDFTLLPQRLATISDQPHTEYRAASDREATEQAMQATVIGFDLETTSPDRAGRFDVCCADIVGYSVATGPGQAVYVAEKPQRIAAVLENPLQDKVFHNATFEVMKLRQAGVRPVRYHDTKLMAYLLGEPSTHLKVLARQHLGTDPLDFRQVAEGGDITKADPDLLVQYAAADADNTLQLFHLLRRRLRSVGLWDLYHGIELPVVEVLVDMMLHGVWVDLEALEAVRRDLEREVAVRLDSLTAAHDINWNSSQQVADLLADLGAPISARTPTGRLRTDEATLREAADWNPELIGCLLDYRKFRKLLSYVENYRQFVHPDGRIHPQFLHAGTVGEDHGDANAPATGRLACRNPNLQNVPHHTDEVWGRRIRSIIAAPPGCVLVKADVAQEEPRIGALLANERQMLADFDSGRPVYSYIGEAIYGRPIDKHADLHEWQVSKIFFLALWYGADWRKLREVDPTLTPAQARRGAEAVARRYPGIRRYAAETEAFLRQNGFMRDWFGRIRYIPKIWEKNRRLQEEAIREAVNYRIQATAATVLKKALLRIWRQLRGHDAHLVLTVHDEVVVEAAEHEADFVAGVLRHMTDNILPVRLPVEVSIGRNWAEMEEV